MFMKFLMDTIEPLSLTNEHSLITRSKDGTSKPKVLLATKILVESIFIAKAFQHQE